MCSFSSPVKQAACGGGLYFLASFTTALMLVLLRFGPRFLVHSESIVLPFHSEEKGMSTRSKPPKPGMSFGYD